MHSSTSICNIVQDSNGSIMLNSHVNVAEDIDLSRQNINLDSDSNSVSSTTYVASIVSGESSKDNLLTEYESEDSSSVNHQFVNDFEVCSNFISQVDAEVNFALALSFTRTLRLSRNSEDEIVIRKKKYASKNEKMIALFIVIKWGWNDSSVTFKMKTMITKATCSQVAYDYGFKNSFATSQLPVWERKKFCN